MRQYPRHLACVLVLSVVPLAGVCRADERLKGIACRSVHLFYPAPEGTAFYNEVTVDRSADGTYFMACGFRMGYFGIQELGNGKKVVLFSVWEPGAQNDPKAVKEDRRVKLVAKGEKVRVKRFGGEGTGGQSFLDYDWKPGQTCRFLVRARPQGQRTEYAAWFYLPEKKQWQHMATFSTLTGGKLLSGYYSFIEDFRRNRISATKVRQAHFGGAWVQTREGKWIRLTRAKFTADRNPVTNINAGVEGDRFFLATGGKTENRDTKLGKQMGLPDRERTPPRGLPALGKDR
jgi:Domain of unknown function (DUF3472)